MPEYSNAPSASAPAVLTPSGLWLSQLLALPFPALVWVTDQLFAAGSLYIWAGAPKRGKKTWTLLHLALCVARGLPFLGRATAKREVVYAALEDGHRRIKDRLLKLGVTECLPIYFAFTVSELLRAMDAVRGGGEPPLVIIDTLVNWESHEKVRDENSSLEIEKALGRLRTFTRDTGATAMLAHHFRKDGLAMRGSSALQGSTDGWAEVREVEGEHGLLMMTATLRDAPDQAIWFRVEPDLDGMMRVFDVPEPASSSEVRDSNVTLDAEAEGVRSVLRAASTDERFTQEALMERTSLARAKLRKILKYLEQNTEVHRPDGERSGYARTDSLHSPPMDLSAALAISTPPTASQP